MTQVDSYDALAASIERSLRTDLGPTDSGTELPVSIEQRLHEEARTGELALAWIRAGVAAISLALSLWSIVLPRIATSEQAATGFVLRALWLALAVALLLALRRGWYRLWLRRLVPLSDGAMILGGFVLLWGVPRGGVANVPPSAVGYLAVLCGYLAVSGAMRLSHSAAQLSAVLGVVVFALSAAAARLPVVPSVAVACTLALLGLLGMSATGLVRRVVTHEVGRTELSHRYATARDAINVREEVLKIVSHDLRNPLATIAMSADLMMEMEMSPEQHARQLAVIRRAGERMNRLIQDLLDVAKLEAGRMSVVRRPVDVAALLDEAQEQLAPLAADKSIVLEVQCGAGLPELSADAGRAQQAIGNLVGNAIKFTPGGGRIQIRAEVADSGVRFAVSDTGAGIPPDQLTKIFGRFWQADRADRRGIGLGLAITKAIVEAHGGRIWVESRVNQGTTFYFTLDASPEGGATRATASTSGDRRQATPPVRTAQ